MEQETAADFMVVVSPHGDKPYPKGLGCHSFRVAPRTGEYVEVAGEDGLAQLYKVKAVIHPLEVTATAGDLLLEFLGPTVEILKKLHA